VTAYRLVTDEYPAPTQPQESGSEVWREGGAGARPPRELNPRVSPALNALIVRLLAVAPVERFRGLATQAAEALEQAAQGEGPEGDELLFRWSDEHHPMLRSRGRARLAEEQDAAARREQAQREEQARAEAQADRGPTPGTEPRWRPEMAVALMALLVAGLSVVLQLRGREVAPSTSDSAVQERGRVAVGDTASTPPAGTQASAQAGDEGQGLKAPLPEQSFPGQKKPPCRKTGEVEIRGGCWLRVDVKPPCKEEDKEEAFLWKGACYLPTYPPGREPTSSPP
jgi:hypothetical protein